MAKEKALKNGSGQEVAGNVFIITIRDEVTLWDAQEVIKRFLPRLESAIVLGNMVAYESEHDCTDPNQPWPYGVRPSCAEGADDNGQATQQIEEIR